MLTHNSESANITVSMEEIANTPNNNPLSPEISPAAKTVEDKPANRDTIIKVEGRVIEALPNAFFKVVLDDGKELRGFLSGKMRLNRIKILPGDKVTLEVASDDQSKGRIVYRLK